MDLTFITDVSYFLNRESESPRRTLIGFLCAFECVLAFDRQGASKFLTLHVHYYLLSFKCIVFGRPLTVAFEPRLGVREIEAQSFFIMVLFNISVSCWIRPSLKQWVINRVLKSCNRLYLNMRHFPFITRPI